MFTIPLRPLGSSRRKRERERERELADRGSGGLLSRGFVHRGPRRGELRKASDREMKKREREGERFRQGAGRKEILRASYGERERESMR
jgi:hypothetical protein